MDIYIYIYIYIYIDNLQAAYFLQVDFYSSESLALELTAWA